VASKKDFLTAYCWMYDSTTTEASAIYREMSMTDPDYINDIVEAFRQNCKSAFYAD
jgi:hypothetical protein